LDQRTALTDAMTSLRAGRLDDAESTLTRMLAVAPDQPDALHLSGLCRHERGDTAAAERLIRAAIRSWPDADPQVCVPWNNLGNVLVESGQPEAAVDAYERALAAQPDAAGTWNNLAGLLRRLRRLDEAEHAARRSVAVAADDPYAWFTLARVLIEAGDVHEGLQAHARGVALAPREQIGREEVLRSLAILGHRDEAAALWEEWLQEHPDDPIALHHLAACSGSPPPHAARAYVEGLFDSFASSFDAKLAKLGYRAPELVVGVLAASLGGRDDWGAVADLGCGTGLVGMLLRPHARGLVGVDLSQAMLERARQRGVYDALVHADLQSFLVDEPHTFDVVVAADVLCYFGVLDEVLAAAGAALRPGGVMAFTVEALPDEDGDWTLAVTGRYAHSPRYVAAALAGFDELTIDPCTVRMEAGLPVPGLLVCARAHAA